MFAEPMEQICNFDTDRLCVQVALVVEEYAHAGRDDVGHVSAFPAQSGSLEAGGVLAHHNPDVEPRKAGGSAMLRRASHPGGRTAIAVYTRRCAEAIIKE